MNLNDEERRIRRKESMKKYLASSKGKIAIAKRNSSEKAKEARKKYEQSPKGKESMKKYLASSKGKIAIAKRNSSEKAKEARKKYEQSPKGYSRQKKYRDNLRLEVLIHYSKTLSNSNIPCCNCCGENFHIDFLAVDHIAGKKQMDFEPELVRLGYSSKLTGRDLPLWIINNNFPKGFQILCSNCNFAKGMIKNNNKCPHESNIERK